jgi:uncharacterized Zn finger protein
VLYGVGARLDEDPTLLFRLRGVDHSELIASAAKAISEPTSRQKKPSLSDRDLAEVFGIELAPTPPARQAGRMKLLASRAAGKLKSAKKSS